MKLTGTKAVNHAPFSARDTLKSFQLDCLEPNLSFLTTSCWHRAQLSGLAIRRPLTSRSALTAVERLRLNPEDKT